MTISSSSRTRTRMDAKSRRRFRRRALFSPGACASTTRARRDATACTRLHTIFVHRSRRARACRCRPGGSEFREHNRRCTPIYASDGSSTKRLLRPSRPIRPTIPPYPRRRPRTGAAHISRNHPQDTIPRFPDQALCHTFGPRARVPRSFRDCGAGLLKSHRFSTGGSGRGGSRSIARGGCAVLTAPGRTRGTRARPVRMEVSLRYGMGKGIRSTRRR